MSTLSGLSQYTAMLILLPMIPSFLLVCLVVLAGFKIVSSLFPNDQG